jgi:hypothetical protein
VEFFSRLGLGRSRKFAAYRAWDSGLPLSEALANNDVNCRLAYGHDVPVADVNSGAYNGIVAHHVDDYAELVSFLKAANYRFKTGRQLHQEEPGPRTCHLRHDVDGDLLGALLCGEMLASLGVQGSFYILHTGPYYGEWRQDEQGPFFARHASLGAVYKRLQDLGHEVGLHTDGLGVYLNHGVDGAQAVRAELAWLNEIGVEVTGTAAHNSFETHNACNSAVFRGRSLIPPNHTLYKGVKVSRWSTMNGVRYPLGTIDERAVGLVYEDNDVYGQVGSGYRDLLYASTYGHEKVFIYSWRDLASGDDAGRTVSHSALKSWIGAADPQDLIYISSHPEYYGRRGASELDKLLQRNFSA